MNNLEMLKPSKRKRQKRRDKRLHEELIECYRHGRGWPNKAKGYDKRQVGSDFQYARKQESIKFRSGGGTKWQNDNLSPLIRFLEQNQGKNWDKIYSCLCQTMSKNSLLGQHLFDHLFDFVETKVYFEDGKIMGCGWGRPMELISWSRWPQFYVHPETGQLLKVKKKRRKRW